MTNFGEDAVGAVALVDVISTVYRIENPASSANTGSRVTVSVAFSALSRPTLPLELRDVGTVCLRVVAVSAGKLELALTLALAVASTSMLASALVLALMSVQCTGIVPPITELVQQSPAQLKRTPWAKEPSGCGKKKGNVPAISIGKQAHVE
jgi:hypothetical protein